MKILFIKNANTNSYYAINKTGLEQVLLAIPALSDLEILDCKNISDIEEGRKYFFDKVVIRGEEHFINPNNSYPRTQLGYVTDDNLLDELSAIYQEYLQRKENNVAFRFSYELKKDKWIQVLELTDNSTAMIEIDYDITKPITKGK